jgi:hypothetical protein
MLGASAKTNGICRSGPFYPDAPCRQPRADPPSIGLESQSQISNRNKQLLETRATSTKQRTAHGSNRDIRTTPTPSDRSSNRPTSKPSKSPAAVARTLTSNVKPPTSSLFPVGSPRPLMLISVHVAKKRQFRRNGCPIPRGIFGRP